MSRAHVLGFPRIGAQREAARALEHYWRDGRSAHGLRVLAETGRAVRAENWRMQRDAGLDLVTAGDFAWGDHVLTTLAHLGGLPRRFGADPERLTLDALFDALRGTGSRPAMETAAWFDTNCRYVVPEFGPDTAFGPGVGWLFDEVAEAQALGHSVKVALVGPLTLLWLGRSRGGLGNRLALLPALLAAYRALLARLAAQHVEWVQIDEPVLALELPEAWLDALQPACAALADGAPKLLLTTGFGDVSALAARLKALPVAGLHLDLARADAQLDAFLAGWPADKVLSCGVVDGRNVWRNDLDRSHARLAAARAALGDRLWVATSCSLLHVPVDLRAETKLDEELKSWLAFAAQKAREVALLRDALVRGREAVAGALDEARRAAEARAASPRVRNVLVERRVAALGEADLRRGSPYAVRAARQQARFALPPLPTTTIGSFPCTDGLRDTREAFRRGALDHLGYLEAMREQIRYAIDKQLHYGLDVLVHGEAERDDMVEFFAGQLWGCAVTEAGWVQRGPAACVKPPIVYGDVYLPEPMTVGWTQYAQSLTDKPVKGLLTGPMTLLQRSFVRDDLPRETVALQLALALRQETIELEKAGIGMIQIDEPALRDGLPLAAAGRAAFLDLAVRAFRVASSGVADDTQIHTHICDASLDDVLPAIAALDADVISIETTHSNGTLLDTGYPNAIGPGVYDIHSPRVPDEDEIAARLAAALERVPATRLWVNPDCGLREREWAQVDAALHALVGAARRLREQVAAFG
ncbi:5-methyltetrahydropteroyltriglutamate--homocysteine S-methyltransferase [Burkholderia glumae]|uniref:5-methyltetrahydropteroyltriglutamate-- homocysteine S-methyltransferase n=1 Tax=Burkholderia glumae TaxID=337 RepID=UPI001463AC33|nr:5-methyltetrahydropteroyltriglutamate--homocysteine S-methyltransferase [Burkholderia glumae]QJP73855.1 5-methyltetrahydropteroyltriglutamate--homocysteine S-methyltransferase [Burkholderia glumae]